MQRRCGPRRRSARLQGLGGGGADLISALPDDLLLLILTHLPCASAAARTGILSRRWRSLWAHLRQIVFRDVPFRSLEAVLGRFPRPPPAVSLIDIRFPNRVHKEQRADEASVNSLLCAAALLEPEKFEIHCWSELIHRSRVVNLPCFHRATSIVLDFPLGFLRVPAGGEFPALETLSLTHCKVAIDRLLSCCPRLRKLCLGLVSFNKDDLTVKSATLQELVVMERTRPPTGWIKRVNIVTPVLKQLTMSLYIPESHDISVMAPMVEKISWLCHFGVDAGVFDLLRLHEVELKTAEGQLPSLHIDAFARVPNFYGKMDAFTQEIEKHLIVKFSILELCLATTRHGFGALAFHLLGMNRIRRATRRLKITLERIMVNGEEWQFDCPCEPEGWRSNTVSLTALQELEINGFVGDDHELDFLKLMFKCAPMLKKLTVELSHEASSRNDGCTELYNIVKACSSVELYVYLSSAHYDSNQSLFQFASA